MAHCRHSEKLKTTHRYYKHINLMSQEYSVVQLSHKNRDGVEETFDIDEAIVPLVRAIWEKGFITDSIYRLDEGYRVMCRIGMPLDDFKKLICVMLNSNVPVTKEETHKIRRSVTLTRFAYSIMDVGDDFEPDCINIYVHIGIDYKDIPYVISRLT